jgi:hypothetical protein
VNPDWIEKQQDPFEIESQEIFGHSVRAFYDGSLKHWSGQSAPIVGMLNADESLSDLDLAFSKRLVDLYVTDHNIPTGFCIDIASGIGRITVNMLSNYDKRIDLIDPIDRFIMKAEEERIGIGIAVGKFVTTAQFGRRTSIITYFLDTDLQCG